MDTLKTLDRQFDRQSRKDLFAASMPGRSEQEQMWSVTGKWGVIYVRFVVVVDGKHNDQLARRSDYLSEKHAFTSNNQWKMIECTSHSSADGERRGTQIDHNQPHNNRWCILI